MAEPTVPASNRRALLACAGAACAAVLAGCARYNSSNGIAGGQTAQGGSSSAAPASPAGSNGSAVLARTTDIPVGGGVRALEAESARPVCDHGPAEAEGVDAAAIRLPELHLCARNRPAVERREDDAGQHVPGPDPLPQRRHASAERPEAILRRRLAARRERLRSRRRGQPGQDSCGGDHADERQPLHDASH